MSLDQLRHELETMAEAVRPSRSDPVTAVRRRRRRQNRVRIGALSVSVVVIAVVAAVGLSIRAGRSGPTPVGIPHTSGSAPGVAEPAFYVGYGNVGPFQTGILVVQTSTGHVIRRIPNAPLEYLDIDFQLTPDRKYLYYSGYFSDRPADQSTQILRLPIAAGPATVVVNGYHPTISPDGTLMAYSRGGSVHAVAIMNLKTGSTAQLFFPAAVAARATAQDGAVLSMAWLSDSRHLLVIVGTIPPRCGALVTNAHPDPCGRTRPAEAFVYQTARPSWSNARSPNAIPNGWTTLQLEGPGATPGTVLATDRYGSILYTIQAATGTVTEQTDVPAADRFLARDATAHHILLQGGGNTEAWQPSQTKVTPVGPPVSYASW